MTEPSAIQALTQGGAVGISLLCLWIIYKLVNNHDKHLLDALERNTDAWTENAKALTLLNERLGRK